MSLRTFRRLFLNAAFLHVFFPAHAGVMCPPPNIETWENLDGMVDDEAILRGLNPAAQDAGANASEIRYVHDADDRLLGAFTTTAGGTGGGAGGGTATYTLSPAHNALAAGERSAP